MFLDIDAGFDDRDAFALKKFALQTGVWFANQYLAIGAEDAVPGNTFA